MLCCKMVTNVTGCLGPILKGHAAVEEEMDCLTRNDELTSCPKPSETNYEPTLCKFQRTEVLNYTAVEV